MYEVLQGTTLEGETVAQLNWTETQWDRVNSAITEEFTKASVAGAFLPCYGPLEGGSETVQKELLSYDADGASIKIRTDENYTLWNLRVHVALSQQQVLEESLSSAMLAFRRAATRLAKAEDYIVFCGHSRLEPDTPPASAVRPILKGVAPEGLLAMVASGGPEAIGLTEEGTNYGGKRKPGVRNGTLFDPAGTRGAPPPLLTGPLLAGAVAHAIVALEGTAHSGPYACVLGNKLFVTAHTPYEDSSVLPSQQITPLLERGPLLRSSNIQEDIGLVVALGGENIDIVVATPPRAQFLQITADAKYLFRVYERFVLRIKEATALSEGSVYCFR